MRIFQEPMIRVEIDIIPRNRTREGIWILPLNEIRLFIARFLAYRSLK